MRSAIVPRRLLRVSLFLLTWAVVGIVLTRWLGRPFSTSHNDNVASSRSPQQTFSPTVPSFCDALDIDNIAFVIKTGATEALLKLPPQLSTSLSCVPEPLIFSDLDGKIGPYFIHDVLANFSPEAMENNLDFDIYHKQRNLAAQGRFKDIEKLSDLPILTYDWRAKGRNAAWALDKYKFLHMIDEAFKHQPDKDWYVFVEADTYLSLANLVHFLATKTPKEKLYFGNAVRMFEHQTELYFAHGGSGFILSHATVKDFAKKYNGVAKLEWDMRTRHEWFGDFLVADALEEISNVKLTDVLPMMQGDDPLEFPFGEHSWCLPAITLHHMAAEDFKKVFDYEVARNFTGMLYKDIFALYFHEPFPAQKENWQNSADNGKFKIEWSPNDVEELPAGSNRDEMKDPDKSLEACRLGCVQNPYCFQFSYHTLENDRHRCHLSSVFIYGHEYEADKLDVVKGITSGWLSDRITNWTEEHGDCFG